MPTTPSSSSSEVRRSSGSTPMHRRPCSLRWRRTSTRATPRSGHPHRRRHRRGFALPRTLRLLRAGSRPRNRDPAGGLGVASGPGGERADGRHDRLVPRGERPRHLEVRSGTAERSQIHGRAGAHGDDDPRDAPQTSRRHRRRQQPVSTGRRPHPHGLRLALIIAGPAGPWRAGPTAGWTRGAARVRPATGCAAHRTADLSEARPGYSRICPEPEPQREIILGKRALRFRFGGSRRTFAW